MQGMTLLELILVLAISASVFLLGFGMYQRYYIEQEFNQLKYNVDTLMQGMRFFYQGNCGGDNGQLSVIRDPDILSKPYSINISDQLLDKKYLTANWPQIITLLDETFGYEGYSAKFNPIKLVGKKIAGTCYNDTGKIACGSEPLTKSEIIFWQLEIAVKINNLNLAQRYWAYVGATCTVRAITDAIPVDCNTDKSDQGQILVWQTLPSDAVTNINSDAWLTTPVVKQFNLLYTQDPMYDLSVPQTKYYLCGG